MPSKLLNIINSDYYPLIIATVVALVNSFNSYISDVVIKVMNRQTSQERSLIRRRLELQRDQSSLNMVSQFSKYSKIQREINRIESELDDIRQNKPSNSLLTRLAVHHGLKFPLAVAVICVSVYYRNTPVLVLDKKYDLYPFTNFIAYPNQERNAVSAHVWILCCSALAYLIKT